MTAVLARLSSGRTRLDLLVRLRDAGIGLTILVLFAVFALVQPRFAGLDNISELAKQTAIFAMLALGETLVVLTRNIDLSVGSTTGLAAMVVALQLRSHPGMPTAVAMLIAIGVGLACGLGNGLLVAIGRVPSIVATLGTLSLIRAVLFLVGGSRQVSGNDIPARIGRLATTSPVHLPYLVVLALVLFVVAWLYLARTRSGRYFYAVGSNPEGAAARGLPVTRVVIAAFALSGMIAGLAGLMYVARFGSVEPGSAGIGYELWAISAVVVGGTSILGGSGGAVHTFFGVLLIGVVSNGVTITGLSSAWQTVAQGAIILVAITADSAIRRSYAARRQHARRRLA